MSDPLVDRLEVVDVEHEECKAPAVAVRACALALERLVEEPPVAQAGQRVGVGKPASLAVSKGVVERGHAAADDLVDVTVDGAGEIVSSSGDDGRASRASRVPRRAAP